MAENVLAPYLRAPRPTLRESQDKYLDDELRKIEMVTHRLVEAVEDIRARLNAAGL